MIKIHLTATVILAFLLSACGPSAGEEYAQRWCECDEASKEDPSKAMECFEISQEFRELYGDDEDEIKDYTRVHGECTGVSPESDDEE